MRLNIVGRNYFPERQEDSKETGCLGFRDPFRLNRPDLIREGLITNRACALTITYTYRRTIQSESIFFLVYYLFCFLTILIVHL